MGKCFNKTILIGRLVKNPEIETITSKVEEHKRATLIISNSTVNNGVETVEMHTVVSFDKQAELCMKHLSVGDLLCIEGRLTSDNYKDGLKRQVIACEHITFLSSKRNKTEDNAQ